MPSRDEIVEWLRKAGRIDVALARMNGAGEEGAKDFALPWEQRAEQVSSMRCETCKKKEVVTIDYMWEPPLKDIQICPGSLCVDGCLSHEQKPAG